MLAAFYKVFARSMMGNCGYDHQLAAAAINNKAADAIAFGRPFISSLNLVELFKTEWLLADAASSELWHSFQIAFGNLTLLERVLHFVVVCQPLLFPLPFRPGQARRKILWLAINDRFAQ